MRRPIPTALPYRIALPKAKERMQMQAARVRIWTIGLVSTGLALAFAAGGSGQSLPVAHVAVCQSYYPGMPCLGPIQSVYTFEG